VQDRMINQLDDGIGHGKSPESIFD
jgi:hypothetical protein